MAQYTELRYFHQPPKQAQQTSQQVININNQISELQQQINTKVDKQYNKQLSQKSFTITDKNTISKSQNQIVDLQNQINSLPDIVQSDWNTQDVDDMSYIKNKPNVPILDQSGQIPASYLPSYVDDILEYPSFHDLPQPGEPGKIYVTTDNDLTYRWSGTTYIEISKSIITGVKGDAEADYRIGNVNLTAANIGLGNVVNIDQSKAIKGITRNGLTFTYTCLDGTTGTFDQQDNNTTYSAGTGLQLTNTAFSVKLGYTTSGNNRAVQADTNGNLYVTQKDDNTWTAWKGATASADGTAGYMPAPTKAQYQQFLRGDGTWVSLNNYSLPLAANGTRGGIQIGYTQSGKNYPVQLSSEKAYVNVPWTDTNTWRPLGTGASDACAGNDSRLSNSRPASDVYSWAKAATKPSYAWSEITDKPTTFTPSSHTHNYIKHVAKAEDECIPEVADSFQSFRCSSSSTGFGDGYIMAQRWSGGNYITQLYTEVDAQHALCYRYRNSAGTWGDWKRIPMGDGTGASGTWGINITGTSPWANITSKPWIYAEKALTTRQWYRILDVLTYPTSFLLTFGPSYAYNEPTSVTFLVQHSYNHVSIRQLGATPVAGVVSQVRAIFHDTYKMYIEFYYNQASNQSNTVRYTVIPLTERTRGNISQIDFTAGSGTAAASCSTSTMVLAEALNNSAIGMLIQGRGGISSTGSDQDLWIYHSPANSRTVIYDASYVHLYPKLKIGSDYSQFSVPSETLYVNGSAKITGQLDVTGAINTDSYINCTNLNAIDDVTISKGTGAARLRISNAGVLNANNVIEFSQDNAGNTKHFQIQDRMNSDNTRRYFSIWGYNYGSLISASCSGGSSNCCVGIGGGSNLLWDTTAKLYVNGNAKASAWNTTSDIRLKDVKGNTDISIETIANAPLFYFYWKDKQDENKHVGTSAQYWQKVLPEVVSGTDESKFTVDYGVTALASAITVAREVVEYDKKIKQLEEENKQLKEELQLLKSQINDILTTINKSTNNE